MPYSIESLQNSPEFSRTGAWWYNVLPQVQKQVADEGQIINLPLIARLKPPVLDSLSSLLGINENGREPFSSSFVGEGIRLPSTQRLFGYAQINPAVNQLLGVELTRGQHTLDCMQLTAKTLTEAAIFYPAQFDQYTQDYQKDDLKDDILPGIKNQRLRRRVKVVMHFVEYMRRHDEMTLPLQGITHHALGYDEDEQLLEVLNRNPLPVDAVSYYQKYDLDPQLIKKIAGDALLDIGNPLTKMLKGSIKYGSRLSFDTIAYTLRDSLTMIEIFRGVDPNTSPLQTLFGAYARLQELSLCLENPGLRDKFLIPQHPAGKFSITKYIPDNFLSFENLEDGPKIAYGNPAFAYRIFLSHILSRLCISGSPWVRGTNQQFAQEYLSLQPEFKEPVSELMQGTKEMFPENSWVNFLMPEALDSPNLLPNEVRGWNYSAAGETPARFKFKDVSQTLLKTPQGFITFKDAFPKIHQLKHDLESKDQLFLKHQVC